MIVMAFDALPSGVRLLPELITEEQESALVAALDDGVWEDGARDDGHRSQQFGWWRPQLLAQSGQPDRFLGALPDWAAPLVSRLHVLAPFDYAPDHLVVRELVPGASPQLRKGEGRTVATLALLNDLPVRFRKREGSGDWHLSQPRRSLLVLTERFDRSWDRTILPTGLPEGGQPHVTVAGHPAGLPSGRLLTLTFRRVSES
ncbi:hypothetical protein DLJ49_13440 [Rhodovulum sp. 12E13]|nr:hypothetical protein DLJ49_13440 [Rhodovulum sp. 12E13]